MLLIWTERGLLFLAVLCFMYFGASIWSSHSNAQADVNEFQARRMLTTSQPSYQNWSRSRIRHFEAASANSASAPMAVLKIPAVSIEAPVYPHTNADALELGIEHVRGTAGIDQQGNIGLAAHRDGFFRGLKDIAIGDELELTTLSAQYRFRVESTEIVEPDDVGVLRPSNAHKLTLVTCYPFYYVGSAPQRFIVHATATSE